MNIRVIGAMTEQELEKSFREGSGKRIMTAVKTTGLLKSGDRVIAGVSGGADSVCLLFVLHALSKELDFSLAVLHVEHGIRGAASREDAEFVRQLCAEYRIPFWMKAVDVPSARRSHVSEEETARNLRRNAYREATAYFYSGEPVKIALAHNAEDQAETVLMHLIRGTGLKGLCGMEQEALLHPENKGTETTETEADGVEVTSLHIIRPLLSVQRKEIESYLNSVDQTFRTDQTNTEDAYTRNYLRHHILPELQKLNDRATTHIGETAAALRNIERELEEDLEKTVNEIVVNNRFNRIYAAAYPQETQNRLIKSWIYKKNGTVRNISSTHIRAVCALLCAPNGTKADIPGKYRIRVEGEWLVWEEKSGRNAPGTWGR